MADQAKHSAQELVSVATDALLEISALQMMIAYLIPQVAGLSESAALHLDLAQKDLESVRSSMDAAKVARMN